MKVKEGKWITYGRREAQKKLEHMKLMRQPMKVDFRKHKSPNNLIGKVEEKSREMILRKNEANIAEKLESDFEKALERPN